MAFDQDVKTYADRLSEAVHLHKYQPMPFLRPIFALSELTDVGFCSCVSSDLAGCGSKWEVRWATPELWAQIPQAGGLYMFVFAPPVRFQLANRPQSPEQIRHVLYVGKAGASESGGTLKSRYKTEYSQYIAKDPALLWEPHPTKREHLMRKYLNLYPLEYWYLQVEDRQAINRMEQRLIKVLNPLLNVQGTIRLKPGITRAAFTEGAK